MDRNKDGGGVIIYVMEAIPCRVHTIHSEGNDLDNVEGIFLEINLRKTKWFGSYNHKKTNINKFLVNLGPMLEHHMSKFEHFLVIGDLSSVTYVVTYIVYVI